MRSLIGLSVVFWGCSEAVLGNDPTLDKDGVTNPDGDDDDDTTPLPPQNQAPISDAGPDLVAFVAEEVELDGTGSYDPDGDAIAFEWTMVDAPIGSASFLINDSRPNPSFYADRPGEYVIELAVDDGLIVSTDEVSVLVDAPNEGPVANAGPDQSVNAGDRVVLNGSNSYDPDGDPLTFVWTMVSTPGGSGASLASPDTALPQFTADLAGLYVLELVVTDGTASSLADQVRITAQDGGDSDCLSCAGAEQELRRRAQAGDLASALSLGALPILVLLWQRRRDDDVA